MKNLTAIKSLADMHYAAYEAAITVHNAEIEKTKHSNYALRVNCAKTSADAQEEYNNINYDLQKIEKETNPFDDLEEKPQVTYTPRHITMVERLQMQKARGLIYTPVSEEIECIYEEV